MPTHLEDWMASPEFAESIYQEYVLGKPRDQVSREANITEDQLEAILRHHERTTGLSRPRNLAWRDLWASVHRAIGVQRLFDHLSKGR